MIIKITKGGILALALLCVFTGSALAEGNIRIGDGDSSVANYRVQSNVGAYINPETALGSGLLDFFTSAPGDPRSDVGRIASGSGVGQYSVTSFPALHYWEYFFKINDSPIVVRAWTGSKAMGETNFYGYQTTGYANDGTTPVALRLGPSGVPSNQYMGTFITNWQAMPPYPPQIDRSRDIVESQVRDDYSTRVNLTLNITVSPVTGTPPRQISPNSPGSTNYLLEITYPDGSIHTEFTNGTFTLTGTPTGLYRFRAKAYNWFGGSEFSGYTDWQTLSGGGMGGAGPITYNLTYEAGGLGLNSVAVLHDVPFNVDTTVPAEVSSVSQFVSELNAKLGAGTVRAIGWLENSRIVGYMISYTGSTANYVSVGGVAADGAATLTRGQSIQLYVTTPGSVTFSQ
jgi:hypothetical protein